MKKIIAVAAIMTLLAGCETMQTKGATSVSEDKPTAAVVPVVTTPAKPTAPQKKLGPKAQAKKDAEDRKAARLEAAAARKAQQQEAAEAAASAAEPVPTSNSKTREVKGINDWTGQIIGTPVNGKFSGLKIGMGVNEVISVAGAPTDTRSHITGKAWIPFYFGSGRYETVFYYKGVGRLTFSGGAGAYSIGVNDGSGLTVIEYDKAERGFQ